MYGSSTKLTKENFLTNLLYILNDDISTILSGINNLSYCRAVVVGNKAANIALKRQYQLVANKWDINVGDPSGGEHEKARDYLGTLFSTWLHGSLQSQRHRIQPLLDHFHLNSITVSYLTSPKTYLHYGGSKYTLGQVVIFMENFGQRSIINLAALLQSGNYVNYAGVNFLKLENIIYNLTQLSSIAKYRDQLLKIRHAYDNQGFSCNFHRTRANFSPSDFLPCVRNTIMGPPDLVFSPSLREISQRFRITSRDVFDHYKYFSSLPQPNKNYIMTYTTSSYAINVALLNEYINSHLPISNIPEYEVLQNSILRAPPLTKDTYVYRVSRYLFLKTHSTYELVPGTIELQPTFVSTSFDNYLNYSPFVGSFSPCCAWVIKVPQGSQVLIVDRHSSVPEEHEVLLPYGCGFYINRRETKYITAGWDPVYYHEITVYYVDYISPSQVVTLNNNNKISCSHLTCHTF